MDLFSVEVKRTPLWESIRSVVPPAALAPLEIEFRLDGTRLEKERAQHIPQK